MKIRTIPEYIFETSWEVCNKVGGIYTVLSTRAASMQQSHKDKVIFFGPDVWRNADCPYFKESKTLFKAWRTRAAREGLFVRIGRWQIPGKPIAVLVGFHNVYPQKNQLYGHIWQQFGVNSIAAYGDYDESAMFGHAVGCAMVSLYNHLQLTPETPVVAHFNEWMTAFALFHIKEHLPQVGTIFTTHATSIGRSIAGNRKPLYDYLHEYNGNQMADELNMTSKHSVERQAAHHADCFTTVSEITARECEQLLEKPVDIVTPNGFEADFVPKERIFGKKRQEARRQLRKVAETLLGHTIADNALLVATSGRYEYKNKGIDIFIESLKCLTERASLQREVIAFVVVPAYISGARKDLQDALASGTPCTTGNRHTTHNLYNESGDPVMDAVRWFHLNNNPADNVKVIFIPSYISDNDGIFNCSYYDLLIGFDLTVFPSYYEPWGYTPLESIAFHIPTVTTSLSGFGQWAKEFSDSIMQGVEVIPRSDYNTHEVVNRIADTIVSYAALSDKAQQSARQQAAIVAEKALWKHFMPYYDQAYAAALLKKL